MQADFNHRSSVSEKVTGFPAKILLFGEYGLVSNADNPSEIQAKALVMPYTSYHGNLRIDPVHKNALQPYAHYLAQECTDIINVEQLLSDAEMGLYFHSDIPCGYGLGSSGALVAAIYDGYARQKITVTHGDPQEFIRLKKDLARMESRFHGQSSGVDPLLSYTGKPLLIDDDAQISTLMLEHDPHGSAHIFLLDSGDAAKTADMSVIFRQKMQDIDFMHALHDNFIPHSNHCIDAFLANKHDVLFDGLKDLSRWSREYLQPMIPEKIVDVWDQGIHDDAFYLKLCGSGGGGYMLGFTRDMTRTKQILSSHPVHSVLCF